MSVHISSLVYRITVGTATRKAVLLKLADCADDDGGNVFPGVPRVARETECSERQVRRIIADMLKLGVLRLVRAGGQGPNTPNRYCFDVAVLRDMAAGRKEIGKVDGKAALVEVDATEKGDMVSGLAGKKGDMVSSFSGSKGDMVSKKGDTESPNPSLPVKELNSLPLEQDAARAGGEGEGKRSFSRDDLQLLAQIPDERRQLAEDVLEAGRHPAIARHLLLPCLTVLGVPPGRDAATYLADWLDAAAERPVSEAAMRSAVKAIRRDRRRDLPWPSDLGKLLAEAAARLLVKHEPGTPSWAAWIAYDKRQPGKASYAAHVERQRTSYATDAQWPPDDPDVLAEGGRCTIPHGTPEHAAWLAHLRQQGRDGAAKAQAMDLGKRDFFEGSRWPLVARDGDASGYRHPGVDTARGSVEVGR